MRLPIPRTSDAMTGTQSPQRRFPGYCLETPRESPRQALADNVLCYCIGSLRSGQRDYKNPGEFTNSLHFLFCSALLPPTSLICTHIFIIHITCVKMTGDGFLYNHINLSAYAFASVLGKVIS